MQLGTIMNEVLVQHALLLEAVNIEELCKSNI